MMISLLIATIVIESAIITLLLLQSIAEKKAYNDIINQGQKHIDELDLYLKTIEKMNQL